MLSESQSVKRFNDLQSELLKSFYGFNRYFYELRTQREFLISNPLHREPHVQTICRELTDVFLLKTPRLMINIPPGFSKPVWEETKVLRSDGAQIKLKDISINDEILTHTGTFKRVKSIFQQGTLKTLKIKTFANREIITAYDHGFLTAKGWKQANQLEINDVLGISIPQHDFGTPLKDEEARLLGYFIGDGCAVGSSANITACDPKEIIDIEHCCKVLGFICKAQKYNLSSRKPHHSQTLVRINIKNGIRDWLRSHGIIGKNSYTKNVPEAILRGNKRAISQFIGAYFSCDGTLGWKGKKRPDNLCSISSVSKDMLSNVRHLLVRLGIRSRVRTRIMKRKTKKQGDVYTSYNLEISSQDDMYNFQQQIPVYHSKGKELKSLNIERQRFDYGILMPDQIISIEENESLPCMCLEVEDDHTFAANDIVVHNSTLCQNFIAYCMAWYPDCRFLYLSHSFDLAATHTHTIKKIIELREYKELFNVHLRRDQSAKDFFETTAGGAVAAFGAKGSIVGRDAGLPGLSRFSGCLLLDDMHKPDEVHSDTIREKVHKNYFETIETRLRSANVPVVFIGQRLHEDDLCAHLLDGADGMIWKHVNLKALDDNGNPLYPEVMPKSKLLTMKEKQPYVFSAQYQQEPVPAGGSLFKEEWFTTFEEEPDIIATFLTLDGAETEKQYNDATAISFWGLYKLQHENIDLDLYGLHWLDCVEEWVEPKDLEALFMDFYARCLRHSVKPTVSAIEKKSSGTTLLSLLKKRQGLSLIDIDRSVADGSKTDRFIEIQPYIASRQITLPLYGKHNAKVIKHMTAITASNVHKRDDICFIAGTRIATKYGYKNIENIKINDTVITPFGYRKVLACGNTGNHEVINSYGLIGTPNHPVFNGKYFERLDTMQHAVNMEKLSLTGLFKWRYLSLLYSMESHIILQGRTDIILAAQRNLKEERVLKDCMWQFMNFIREKKLGRAILFIIKMAILLIMTLITWNVFRIGNIYNYMQKKEKDANVLKQNWNIWQLFVKKPRNGIQAKKEKNGIKKMRKQVCLKDFTSVIKNARNVARNILQGRSIQNHVVQIAETNLTYENLECLNLFANIASKNLNQKDNRCNQEIELHAHKVVTQDSLGKQDVYNLTVDIDGVYYANDALVSNCDTCQMAIDIALVRKLIIRQSETGKKESDDKVKRVMRSFVAGQKMRNKRR